MKITSAVLEKNSELIRLLDPYGGRTIQFNEEEIQFYDGEECWTRLRMPSEENQENHIDGIYDTLARITKVALDEEKDPLCAFQGCWGNCTGYDSDHRMYHCMSCARYDDECECGSITKY